jgi:hypothetical protein
VALPDKNICVKIQDDSPESGIKSTTLVDFCNVKYRVKSNKIRRRGFLNLVPRQNIMLINSL